ncbi:hypothetical protein [Euzebya tangerina]|uniref:hypothetical protein n=1 Tax=Euzebya tangerina TaxID=591198 RepID=UPI000E31D82D|nr:hypothetical protein [Euzebya tangerina]
MSVLDQLEEAWDHAERLDFGYGSTGLRFERTSSSASSSTPRPSEFSEDVWASIHHLWTETEHFHGLGSERYQIGPDRAGELLDALRPHEFDIDVQLAAETALALLPSLLLEPPDALRVVPDLVRCPGSPHRECVAWISPGQKRCEDCQARADWLRHADPDQDASICPNPWGRPQCQSTPEHGGLCKSCAQSLYNSRRTA